MNFANGGVTTLSGAINAAQGTLTVANGAVFPAVPFHICIDTELMTVTANLGGLMSVTRGIEGTAAAAHADGALVVNTVTAADYASFLTSGTLPADLAKTDVANTFTVAPQTFSTDNIAHVNVNVSGINNQTANMQQWPLFGFGGHFASGTGSPLAINNVGALVGFDYFGTRVVYVGPLASNMSVFQAEFPIATIGDNKTNVFVQNTSSSGNSFGVCKALNNPTIPGQTMLWIDAQAGKISLFGVNPVVQQANASQASITAVADANAQAALQAIYNLLLAYGLAPATP